MHDYTVRSMVRARKIPPDFLPVQHKLAGQYVHIIIHFDPLPSDHTRFLINTPLLGHLLRGGVAGASDQRLLCHRPIRRDQLPDWGVPPHHLPLEEEQQGTQSSATPWI
jgi:hypothetical protein